MKKSFFFAIAFAVVFSATVRARSSDLEKHWAGCYEIRRLPVLHIQPQTAEAKDYEDIPIGFKLMTTDGLTAALMGLDLDLNDRWPFKLWKPYSDGRVTLTWSTGFVGYEIWLKETKSRITGTVQYFTDDRPPESFPKLKIEARRVSCGTTRGKK